MKKLIIVRHGERMDEISPMDWLTYCRQNYDDKSTEFMSRINDPHLTRNGFQQAQEVAERMLLELEGIDDIPFIYCSKLIRAVQTAYYIALRLSKPIVISKGFALTAAAVDSAGDTFEYLTIEKIRELCPNVEIIDGDAEEPAIPSQIWYHSLDHAIRNHTVSLVVAHRETIRNLARKRLHTPYCCYGIFDIPVDSNNKPKLNCIGLTRLMQRDGNELPLTSKK